MAVALLAVTAEMASIASSAKTAQKSLSSMRKSVDVVESGLKTVGNAAKTAIKSLTSAFDNSAGKVKAAGQKLAKGFTDSLNSGLKSAPKVAQAAVNQVNTALMAGRNNAFSAGAFISQGFAQGMLSQLGVIQSAAARMAAAADKAIRAKAKIHSPSKVATADGRYYGKGLANGLLDMVKEVWDAAEQLVSIPAVATPNMALAYAGELVSDYNYSSNSEYTIEVPLTVDGKEFARATAVYTQDELNRRQTREERKRGKV